MEAHRGKQADPSALAIRWQSRNSNLELVVVVTSPRYFVRTVAVREASLKDPLMVGPDATCGWPLQAPHRRRCYG
jgi:hypothetical protein